MAESPYPMIEMEAALEAVLARVVALAPRPVPLTQAAGLVIADEVRAGEAMPPFPAASVDGYAVVAADGADDRLVVGDVPAGAEPSIRVGPGTSARIATGAPLPDGADAVVMVERTSLVNGTVRIETAVQAGDGIRPPGIDFDKGDTVLPVGCVLDASRIGLAASVGAAIVNAHPRPRVAVLSTGDELVGVTERPGRGQIRDSNRYALMAAVEEAGGIAIDAGHVPDSEAATEALALVTEAADAVVTSGGVSMGHRDRVKPWLEANGEVVFGRVRVKPGKPATFGLVHGRPFFALPGFPVSALVTFELFVRPAIRTMSGDDRVQRPVWQVTVGEDVRHDPARLEFVRAVVTLTPAGPVARTTGSQTSGRLLSMAGANGLLRLDGAAAVVAAGTAVPALILGPVVAV